ncbi:cysteine proteinase inhibitor [Striga asiatica]|uniref:Cysteine proteinase inhibitor n=1 Tax=Striga asiatica TaxID=4170 RepID=A0A5A7RHR9_STRAF|nr:cysteine proteinase inhibitor [Striga asiatica]
MEPHLDFIWLSLVMVRFMLVGPHPFFSNFLHGIIAGSIGDRVMTYPSPSPVGLGFRRTHIIVDSIGDRAMTYPSPSPVGLGLPKESQVRRRVRISLVSWTHFISLIDYFSFIYVMNFEGRRPHGRMLGAYREIKNLNDKTVMKCAKFAVSEHNKKAGTNFILVKIAMGLKQCVAGEDYSPVAG